MGEAVKLIQVLFEFLALLLLTLGVVLEFELAATVGEASALEA
jgi:hypothetical protein